MGTNFPEQVNCGKRSVLPDRLGTKVKKELAYKKSSRIRKKGKKDRFLLPFGIVNSSVKEMKV